MELEHIIKGCIKQDRKAQNTLYEMYKRPLYVLCLKYCPSEAEAEDNLHNAFIEIFSKIDRYKGNGSFEGWMKRITINKAIDSYKKTVYLLPVYDEIIEDTSVSDQDMDIPLDYLLSVIQELPNQYRLVFCLYELDDYPHKEIAEMLSITESTSKSNLHKAKAILKEKIMARNPSLKNIRNGA
ncbi:ECF RNA polymerase sigma factor SigE [Flavobacterium longum]|uniref:RNA polymerase sigma factor n=1 Tax=Flavobacterium longum TaxID=1299340 RepID=UPI0039E94A3E